MFDREWPKNRRRIEIVEPSTEKALSTQSLRPSRRSPKIVRRKQPPEPKEATIAPVIVPTPKAGHERNPVTKTGRIYARPDPRVSAAQESRRKGCRSSGKGSHTAGIFSVISVSYQPTYLSWSCWERLQSELFFNFNQEAQVPATQEELLVEQITTKHALTFTEEDIPKQRGWIHHNKRPLYVSRRSWFPRRFYLGGFIFLSSVKAKLVLSFINSGVLSFFRPVVIFLTLI